MTKITAQSLSECFYTTDTYQTFSTDLLDDSWFDESEFDNEEFMKDLATLHAEALESNLYGDQPVKEFKVVGTYSPSYYNFQTDQVELEFDVDINFLMEYVKRPANEAEFREFIKERFTSYDGFISFVPNNLMEFYEAIEYEDNENHHKCTTILLGWYMTREVMSEKEYLDYMYDKIHEILWNNFRQFTDETWDEYMKYEKEFNDQKAQTRLKMPDVPPASSYPMDIEEWFKDREEKNEKSN